MTRPPEPAWLMPAETAPHDATWMAWPSGGYALGESVAEAEEAWGAWATVANTVVEHEPLHLLVAPGALQEARRHLSAVVTLHEAPLDDAWYRDIGPTFVVGESGLGAVNWIFNGWGQQDWARWEHDAVASEVATTVSGATRVDSTLTNEGGGIHTDGEGTFLLTESVQLDPLRNPGWTRADVEAELRRKLGARAFIWLPRGLWRDGRRLGTKGHVDIVATFAAPGQVLVHDQRDSSHPDHEITREVLEVLAASTDAHGRPLEVTLLPAPRTLTDTEGWVDYSYVNHYVLNGAVVACAFDDPVDDEARAVLEAAYPGRVVRTVDARPIFARGGGVHCITQQQPTVPEGDR